MKQKIVIVSHCFLNDAAKLRNQDAADMEQERTKKRSFLRQLLERGIEVIQLPCPEFILYGCNRWGHAASQFDTPHFRQEARNMLLFVDCFFLQNKTYFFFSMNFAFIYFKVSTI